MVGMRKDTPPSLALALSSSFQLRREVKLLRAERALLIDTDRARCRVLGSLLDGAGVVVADVEEIDRLSKELMKLHGNPRGGPCTCLLCQPKTEIGQDETRPSGQNEVVGDGEDHTGAPGNKLAIRAAVESTN
jgi:hypothetical protein